MKILYEEPKGVDCLTFSKEEVVGELVQARNPFMHHKNFFTGRVCMYE